MELELLTAILPDFDEFSQLSPRSRKQVENAHKELANLDAHSRRGPFLAGRWCKQIRDAMHRDGQGEGYAAYCRAVDIPKQRFCECIRIYETFAAYEEGKTEDRILHMFHIKMQLLLAQSPKSGLLEEAVELARSGSYVTKAWYEERMGIVNQKKMPPPEDDDLEDDEEADIRRFQGDDLDDDEEDSLPPERTKEFQDSLRANTLAIEDPAEARDELCKILTDDVQWMKKRIATFVTERKVWGGTWYRDIEKAIDLLMAGIQELKRTEIIHTGE